MVKLRDVFPDFFFFSGFCCFFSIFFDFFTRFENKTPGLRLPKALQNP